MHIESLRGDENIKSYSDGILTFLEEKQKRNALCSWTCNLWIFGCQDEEEEER